MEQSESGKNPKRVAVIISRRSPHWASGWAASNALIPIALGLIRENDLLGVPVDPAAATLLATERWDTRTIVVFDIFHDTYDPDTAHLPGTDDIPVISVFLGRKEVASIAGKPLADRVNRDIRAIHNSTGPGSRPPLCVDHAARNVPFYPNLRTVPLTSQGARNGI
jgi:hypothetical protein